MRDIFADGSDVGDRIRSVVDDSYLRDLGVAVSGALGGQVGVVPRLYLRKLIEVMDGVEIHDEYEPRTHYELTVTSAD